MRRVLLLLVIIVAIPAFAYGVAVGLQAKYEHDWQARLAEDFPGTSAEQRAAFSIAFLCQKVSLRAEGASLCSEFDTFELMRTASLVAAGGGLGWLALISLAGRLTRRSRRLLLHVFRPGLYLTNLFLVGLICVLAILAVTALYFGESALIGRVHVGIIAGIAIGALLGVLAIVRASLSVVRATTSRVVGRTASQTGHPALWEFVRDVSTHAKVDPPDQIVLGLDANFFVTEAKVTCIDGEFHGRTMYLSLPLMRVMSRDELAGILGHECGHFRGQDTGFSRRFYPIYRGTSEALQGLDRAGGSQALALMPAAAILSFFLEAFAVTEHKISRDRELAADSVGADIAGPRVMATALVKVHAFTTCWHAIQNEMGGVVQEGKAFTNLSAIFARVVSESAKPESLAGLTEQRLSHPTDSHPPLSVRLDHLRTPLATVAGAALRVDGDDLAITLVADHEQIEQDLSEVEHYLVARALGISSSAESGKQTS